MFGFGMMMLHTYLLAYMPMYYVPSLPALLLFILDNVKGLSILSALLCSFVPLSSYLKDDVIVIMSKIRDEVKRLFLCLYYPAVVLFKRNMPCNAGP